MHGRCRPASRPAAQQRKRGEILERVLRGEDQRTVAAGLVNEGDQMKLPFGFQDGSTGKGRLPLAHVRPRNNWAEREPLAVPLRR